MNPCSLLCWEKQQALEVQWRCQKQAESRSVNNNGGLCSYLSPHHLSTSHCFRSGFGDEQLRCTVPLFWEGLVTGCSTTCAVFFFIFSW
ncbi:hypothetical protein L6164_016904 [Bauhinia variegata]|uniref:Uncharacterized protein n=1 Tax=Bauhinia variegata TaxID=167791 RepID=A0ACB9N607_BAUVA|nr:hypothetical protein L6164_016904 [Bauhinia variegata]